MVKLTHERISGIIMPMVNIQSNVQFHIYQRSEESYDILWFDQYGNMISNVCVSKFNGDTRFEYHASMGGLDDQFDIRLHEILIINADYTDEFGYSFVSENGIIKALVTFTSYLIKELN